MEGDEDELNVNAAGEDKPDKGVSHIDCAVIVKRSRGGESSRAERRRGPCGAGQFVSDPYKER